MYKIFLLLVEYCSNMKFFGMMRACLSYKYKYHTDKYLIFCILYGCCIIKRNDSEQCFLRSPSMDFNGSRDRFSYKSPVRNASCFLISDSRLLYTKEYHPCINMSLSSVGFRSVFMESFFLWASSSDASWPTTF